MIDFKKFEKLIGNGKRKYVRRRGSVGKYHFISYNKELKEVVVMNTKAKRTLTIIQLKHFINDFDFVKMTNEKPLF